ncbi:MAG: energy transducer TonB [Acidobacteriaceae bacterium]
MVQLKVDVPNTPALPSYRPVAATQPPPQPKVGLFREHMPTEGAKYTGVPTTQTNGFGDPTGARTNPNSNSNRVAAYGSFQGTVGVSNGTGAAHNGSVHGVAFGPSYSSRQPGGTGHGKVSTAGFGGNPGMAGGAHAQPGVVQQGAFHNNVVAQNAATKIASADADYTPVQILFHPKPEYTAEAKQMHIQGEVVLEVQFAANGSVRVLRVVHGLGHGLDEQAIRAAEQTRFKPAMKNGRAVDMTTYYRIDFQLA